MKKYVVVLGLVLVTSGVWAQRSHDVALDKRVEEYFKLTLAMDIDRLMDYTHPRIFEVVPKEQLVTILKQSYNNEAFDMTVDSIAVVKYGKPFTDDKIQYVRIDYSMKMLMKFRDSSLFENPQFVQMVLDNAKTSFPGSTAKFDSAKKTFVFYTSAIAVGLNDPAQKGWLFLGYQKNEIVDKIFPAAVMKNLGLQ